MARLCSTAAPQHPARQGNVAAPSRMAQQDRAAALNCNKNQYAWVEPEAKIERRGCFVFPRLRAWRVSVSLPRHRAWQSWVMGDTLHHDVQDCRAKGGGAAGSCCRANAHGVAIPMAARNRSFFWFSLPSQLDAPAENPQN
jgi:hypothetical protein